MCAIHVVVSVSKTSLTMGRPSINSVSLAVFLPGRPKKRRYKDWIAVMLFFSLCVEFTFMLCLHKHGGFEINDFFLFGAHSQDFFV